MNTFLKQLLKYIFMSLFFVMVYILLFDVIYNPHSKSKLFTKEVESVETIITGTSHTLYGLDPSLLNTKSINISEINKPIIIDLEIIKKYLTKTPNLKYVVIPIDYYTLFYSDYGDSYAKRYRHHWGLMNDSMHSFHFIDCQIVTPIDLILYNNNVHLNNFEPHTGIFNHNNKSDILSRIESWHEHWMRKEDYSGITQNIIDFIAFCKSKNIQIILVQMPISRFANQYFLEEYTSLTNKSLSLFKKSSNTYWINYNDNPIFNNDSLFYDCDHLNIEGAKIATSILNDTISSISFRTNPIHQNTN